MNSVCTECTKIAIECYTFMTSCRSTHSQLHTVVNNILNDLNPANSIICVSKSMFISVDSVKFNIRVCFDKKKAKTKRKALKRLKCIASKKVKTIEDDSYEPVSPEIPATSHEPDSGTYTCKECLKIFNRSTNLKSHYLRVHAPKDFKCSECPRKFGSAYLLKLHLTESHITAMCTDCGKTYDNIHSLKMHMASHEDKICPNCGKHYKNINSYKRHLKLQVCGNARADTCYDLKAVPDCRYECDICKKRFTQKGSLRVHINFEHENGKAHVCNWCDKRFSAQSKLKAHVVKHTRERNFTCEICGGKFVTKEALLYHIRIHTGERPYPCPECDERFLSASRRMEHLRRKHRAPTLHCDICSSRFKTSFCLKKHKLKHFDPNSRLFTQKTSDSVVK